MYKLTLYTLFGCHPSKPHKFILRSSSKEWMIHTSSPPMKQPSSSTQTKPNPTPDLLKPLWGAIPTQDVFFSLSILNFLYCYSLFIYLWCSFLWNCAICCPSVCMCVSVFPKQPTSSDGPPKQEHTYTVWFLHPPSPIRLIPPPVELTWSSLLI